MCIVILIHQSFFQSRWCVSPIRLKYKSLGMMRRTAASSLKPMGRLSQTCHCKSCLIWRQVREISDPVTSHLMASGSMTIMSLTWAKKASLSGVAKPGKPFRVVSWRIWIRECQMCNLVTSKHPIVYRLALPRYTVSCLIRSVKLCPKLALRCSDSRIRRCP